MHPRTWNYLVTICILFTISSQIFLCIFNYKGKAIWVELIDHPLKV